jgi:hypothetical protein
MWAPYGAHSISGVDVDYLHIELTAGFIED